jgi:nucleotide-binding universal stress UspA family protein
MDGPRAPAERDVVLCGVDGSSAGFAALRQAIRLTPPGGRLIAVTVYDPALAVHGGWDAPRLAEQITREASAARDAAAAQLSGVAGSQARLVVGDPASTLIALARRHRASLVVVGTHGHSRAAGIVLGGVATTLLHEAPCPVLVARPCTAPERFPCTIAVGTDGSDHAQRAVLWAADAAARFGAKLRVVVASRGGRLDIERLRRVPRLEVADTAPVPALVSASADVDLLVVGSRGLHGVRALGSVSEQVAHKAACSVVVVRPPAADLAEPYAAAG